MAFSTFPQIGSLEQFQRQLNTLVAELQQAAAGYGDALPDPVGEDGRIFVVMPGKTQYQLQAGSWVAL